MPQNSTRLDDITRDTVCLLGMPFDHQSSFRTGPSLAPDRIRESFHSPSAGLWTENGLDLGAMDRFVDLGDLAADNHDRVNLHIETEVIHIIQNMGGQLVGADIVEYNPERDHLSLTAMVAAKFLKEIAGKMIEVAPARGL